MQPACISSIGRSDPARDQPGGVCGAGQFVGAAGVERTCPGCDAGQFAAGGAEPACACAGCGVDPTWGFGLGFAATGFGGAGGGGGGAAAAV